MGNLSVQIGNISFSDLPFFGNGLQEGQMRFLSKTYSVRNQAGANDDCLTDLAQRVSKWFSRRYADARMFFRALQSLGATDAEITRRINTVIQFRDQIPTINSSLAGNQRIQAIYRGFGQLDAQVASLFFNVDGDYIQQLGQDSIEIRLSKEEEMIRECDRVIYFQQLLTPFHRLFTSDEPQSAEPSAPRERARPAQPSSPQTAISAEIPGAVPYYRYNIPPEIQARAARITELRERLGIDVVFSDEYACGISREPMALPIFLRSHPQIQDARRVLLEANRDVAAGRQTDAQAIQNAQADLNNRSLRHLLDAESFENYMSRNGRSCPACREFIIGGEMMIDVALQQQILDFLERTVGNANS
jgi:hypothetical protein